MFDIGFSELIVIAVVALVVIGPERLPTVARTVGALLGRLNRYVSDVKADVEREMRLEEMKKLRAEVEHQAMDIEQQVVGELEATRQAVVAPVAEAEKSLTEVMQETGHTFGEATQALSEVPAGLVANDNLQKNADGAAPELQATPVLAVMPPSATLAQTASTAETVSKA